MSFFKKVKNEPKSYWQYRKYTGECVYEIWKWRTTPILSAAANGIINKRSSSLAAWGGARWAEPRARCEETPSLCPVRAEVANLLKYMRAESDGYVWAEWKQ